MIDVNQVSESKLFMAGRIAVGSARRCGSFAAQCARAPHQRVVWAYAVGEVLRHYLNLPVLLVRAWAAEILLQGGFSSAYYLSKLTVNPAQHVSVGHFLGEGGRHILFVVDDDDPQELFTLEQIILQRLKWTFSSAKICKPFLNFTRMTFSLKTGFSSFFIISVRPANVHGSLACFL